MYSDQERTLPDEGPDEDSGADALRKHPTANFIATIMLLLVIAAIIIATIFIINSGPGEKFSEFYVLGNEGKAANYQLSTDLNGEIQITMAIVNHEYSRQVYLIDIVIDGSVTDTIGPVTLENGQKWEQPVKFRPISSGDGQKVEFVLNRQFQLAREINKPLVLQMIFDAQ